MLKYLDAHPRLAMTLNILVWLAFIVAAGMVLRVTPVS